MPRQLPSSLRLLLLGIFRWVPLVLVVGLWVSALYAPAADALKAQAITPEGGHLYKGKFTAGGVRKVVYLTVAKNGRSGTAFMSCNGVLDGGHIHMPITKGAFFGKSVQKGITSSLLLWSIRGEFTSKTQAKARVSLPDNCDGHSGNVTLTLS